MMYVHLFVYSFIYIYIYRISIINKMSEEVKKAKVPPHKGKINISEAQIVEPVVNNESNTGNENIDKNESEDYVKNLNDQKVVDLGDAGKNKTNEKVVIDFMNEDHIKGFTSAETKKAEENIDDKSQFKDKSAEDLKKEIKAAEDASAKNFTAKDFEDIARFIIFLIDTGISSGLKWWSGDTSDSAYSLPEKKKEMLVYQLTLILTKYQAKFSVEFMFILTILIVYAPAFVKAKNRRKELKTPKPVEQQFSTFQNTTKQPEQSSEVKVEKKEEVIIQNVEEIVNPNIGPKRKKGRPSKA